jgi:hypothetical protein
LNVVENILLIIRVLITKIVVIVFYVQSLLFFPSSSWFLENTNPKNFTLLEFWASLNIECNIFSIFLNHWNFHRILTTLFDLWSREEEWLDSTIKCHILFPYISIEVKKIYHQSHIWDQRLLISIVQIFLFCLYSWHSFFHKLFEF